jgi:hypothetical protein
MYDYLIKIVLYVYCNFMSAPRSKYKGTLRVKRDGYLSFHRAR